MLQEPTRKESSTYKSTLKSKLQVSPSKKRLLHKYDSKAGLVLSYLLSAELRDYTSLIKV